MNRRMLEQWLCAAEVTPPSPAAVAAALGLPADEMSDTAFLRVADRVRSLRFLVAVLHDVFATDMDVCVWLERPRDELGGMSARHALLAGRTSAVEQLAIQTWNDRSAVAAA